MKHGPIALIDEQHAGGRDRAAGTGLRKVLVEPRRRSRRAAARSSRSPTDGDAEIASARRRRALHPATPDDAAAAPRRCSRCSCSPTTSPTSRAPTSTSRATWPSASPSSDRARSGHRIVTLRATRIASAAEFAALAPVWADLGARAGRPSPFLSHEWFSCCWSAVQPDRRPEVVVVSEGPDPVAVVPLMAWTRRLRGLPVRYLGLLEAPDTPELDLLSVAEPRALSSRLLLDHLADRWDWDVLHLQKLGAASNTVKALEEVGPPRFALYRLAPVTSPYLTVVGDSDAFPGRSQRFRKTVRSVQNRLERVGRVSVEGTRVLHPASPVFQEVVELTRRSWKAARGSRSPRCRACRSSSPPSPGCATDRGWLSLWILRLDGRAVAMEYQIRAGGVVHALRADFDSEFAALSPGSHLNHLIARTLSRAAARTSTTWGPATTSTSSVGRPEPTSASGSVSTATGSTLACCEPSRSGSCPPSARCAGGRRERDRRRTAGAEGGARGGRTARCRHGEADPRCRGSGGGGDREAGGLRCRRRPRRRDAGRDGHVCRPRASQSGGAGRRRRRARSAARRGRALRPGGARRGAKASGRVRDGDLGRASRPTTPGRRPPWHQATVLRRGPARSRVRLAGNRAPGGPRCRERSGPDPRCTSI